MHQALSGRRILVFVDRHFVFSRQPDDLPDFCRGILSPAKPLDFESPLPTRWRSTLALSKQSAEATEDHFAKSAAAPGRFASHGAASRFARA